MTPKNTLSLQDILEIENDEEILSFRCPDTGYLLWPLIRNVFIRFIMSDTLKTFLVSEERARRPRVAYVAVLKACAHNILKRRKLRGAILLSSSGSHVLRNGRYFNRLSDHFALAAQNQTVTMESLFSDDWHWPFPRQNERVLFDAPLLSVTALYGKFSVKQKHSKAAKALLQFVAQRANKLLGWSLSEARSDFLTAILSKKIASLPLRRRLYARFFQRTGVRILIREEGCYGGSSVINTVAREHGLITAEYQHGSVSAGHDAYNFALALRSSEEYKRTLPQYFLGYGRWWTNQISAPVIKLNIGNPDHQRYLEKPLDFNGPRKDLLVLGDGLETERHLSLCSTLSKHLGETYRIVFRPHPQERAHVSKNYPLKASNFEIEWSKDFWQAFTTAEIVVSEISTGLFEAIGVVGKIYLWNTLKANFWYPSHPFATFSDADDLVAKIQDGESGRVDASTAEDFWAPNWKENYLAFLESVCPGILDSGEA